MDKSFLGYSKKNKIPFIIKLILFIAFSITPFLKINIFIKLGLILFLMIYRFILLKFNKKSVKIYFFLLISTLMISLFWLIFERVDFLHNVTNAIIKLWILFLSGNALLISINQEEIIDFLKKIKCSSNIILFIIVSLNSLCYFINSFKEIVKSYNARNEDNNLLRKYAYVLRTLSVDCLFLIAECKKVYTIYYDNIIKALEGDKVDVKC